LRTGSVNPFFGNKREKGNNVKKVKAFIQFINSESFKDKLTPLFTKEEYGGIKAIHKWECAVYNRN
jgi:hypothetical protein